MKVALAVLAATTLSISQINAEEFSMPTSVAPRVTGASAAESNGSVFIHMIVTRMVAVKHQQVVVRDGENVEETVTTYKPMFDSKAIELKGEVKVFTRDGKEIERKEVLDRLKNPIPVAISENGKLEAFYRAMFSDDIVVISMPFAEIMPMTIPAGVKGPVMPVGNAFPPAMPVGSVAPAAPDTLQPIYTVPK
jgi:hypothetical protein